MERPECTACLDSGELFVIFDYSTGDGHWMDCSCKYDLVGAASELSEFDGEEPSDY